MRINTLCSRCDKPLETTRLGKQSYCKLCHSLYMKENRPKQKDMTDLQKKKANARAYLHVYVRRGKIVKQCCEICGSSKVEAHHLDYNKPLEVKWLCRECHLNLHTVNKMCHVEQCV